MIKLVMLLVIYLTAKSGKMMKIVMLISFLAVHADSDQTLPEGVI